MANFLKCHITINNRSDSDLKLSHSTLKYGQFEQAPITIPKKSETIAFIATGTDFTPVGTEGTVVYQIDDDTSATISIYFNISAVPLSSNTVTIDTSNQDIGAQLSGFNGKGSVEVCNIKVIDGR